MLRLGLVIAVSLTAAACASVATEKVTIVSQAKGSTFFSLGAPAMSKAPTGQVVAGRVCRLGQTTLLSPPSIRVEHLSSGGRLLESAHAYVPEISFARDQTCSDYVSKVVWTIGTGDIVRACFERGSACAAQAESQAVTKAPATP